LVQKIAMRLRFGLYALPILALFVVSCHDLDPGPALPNDKIDDNDTIDVPDTLTPDFRIPFTGAFAVTCTYREAGWPDQNFQFTDSVRRFDSLKLQVPRTPGSPAYPFVDSTGRLYNDFLSSPYQIHEGSFIGLDSFHLYIHMDQVPHTFSYTIDGKRQ
jgi:hypothetical protein